VSEHEHDVEKLLRRPGRESAQPRADRGGVEARGSPSAFSALGAVARRIGNAAASRLIGAFGAQIEGVNDGEISRPGDLSERGADAASRSAVRGESVTVAAGGAMPGVQRQARGGSFADRVEIESVLAMFLERVAGEQQKTKVSQKGQGLVVTEVIKSALLKLAASEAQMPGPRAASGVNATTRMQMFLSKPGLPSCPAEFAKAAAAQLPASIPRAALNSILGMAISDQPAPAGFPQADPQSGAEIEMGQPPVAQAGREKREAIMRRWSGNDEPSFPKSIDPVSVDPQKVWKLVKPADKAPRQIDARGKPLIPSAGAEQRGALPDPIATMTQIQRLVDEGTLKTQASVDLKLDASLAKSKSQADMLAEIERIVSSVAGVAPKGTTVREVRVFFGEQMVKAIRLAAIAPREPERKGQPGWVGGL
jgi:hypothetical protein